MSDTTTGKKRKRGTEEAAPSTKKARQSSGKRATKKAPTSEPKPKRINKALRNKIKQISDFIGRHLETVLERDESHVVASEAAVIAATMTMRADWDLSDPRMASLLDVQETIVQELVRPIGTLQIPAKFLVLDLDQATAFQDSIKLKIRGHGLESANLLEIELEMHQRKVEASAAAALIEASDNADTINAQNQLLRQTGDFQKAAEPDASGPERKAQQNASPTTATPSVQTEKVEESGLASETVENSSRRSGDHASLSSSIVEHITADTHVEKAEVAEPLLHQNSMGIHTPQQPEGTTIAEQLGLDEKEVGATGVCPAPVKDL